MRSEQGEVGTLIYPLGAEGPGGACSGPEAGKWSPEGPGVGTLQCLGRPAAVKSDLRACGLGTQHVCEGLCAPRRPR